MRKVEALVSPECLEAIQLALVDAGVQGLSVFEGGQFEETEERGGPTVYSVSPRVKVEIFCEDHESARVAQIFASQTSSPARDPARVFVTSVDETVRTRLPYVPPQDLLARPR